MPRLLVLNASGDSGAIGRVRGIVYEHEDDPDGMIRVHEFGGGVIVRAIDDGSLELYQNDGWPLWEDLPGGPDEMREFRSFCDRMLERRA